jgi:heat shock protein HslJ
MKTTTYLALALLMLAGGCKAQQTAIPLSALQGEWNIIELNGRKLVPEETRQLLKFDAEASRINGNAGCNIFAGNIEHNSNNPQNNISFTKVISTRKACFDGMQLENELLKTLDKVSRFDREQEVVSFYDAENNKLFVISPRK